MMTRKNKAENYIIGGLLMECTYFVRDKTENYFEDILSNKNGLMKPYPKDSHGDPRSPIFGNLDGLFFSNSLQATNCSSYGPKRFRVKVSSLVNKYTRAYFSDFYCVPGRRTPRPDSIIIVLTNAGSTADEFCRSHLISLDLATNPFFRIQRIDGDSSYGVWIVNRNCLQVELYYTEAIDIKTVIDDGSANFTDVSTRDIRAYIRVPRPKSEICEYCG
ncbi:hypothetical protein LSH36_338g07016 [Paralvinella palmiformis]|uniref:Phytanoyl-CoA hydroxylase-interacting protein-like C-terminal domain-containing protein n=1 Tax=Paralvinella palmiformis TaxID=53620 RepID=A0AAD9JFE7_9ANNE|nr:hypothetical protein LSH36_338g07016 [Paralvinella palmiformis]